MWLGNANFLAIKEMGMTRLEAGSMGIKLKGLLDKDVVVRAFNLCGKSDYRIIATSFHRICEYSLRRLDPFLHHVYCSSR